MTVGMAWVMPPEHQMAWVVPPEVIATDGVPYPPLESLVAVFGVPGPAGGEVISRVAAEAIAANRAVTVDANGKVVVADVAAIAAAASVIGVSVSATGIGGGPISIRVLGEHTIDGASFAPDAPVWLAGSGTLTQTPPSGIAVLIGWAKSSQLITVQPQLISC
jgi:hypothetical protein